MRRYRNEDNFFDSTCHLHSCFSERSLGQRGVIIVSFYVVDVEADGPAPGLYSMVSFGAVKVTKELDQTFYGQLAPISEEWNPKALVVSKHSRGETLQFPAPIIVMSQFVEWIKETNSKFTHPMFVSDNNGFDWQFINYYLHAFHGSNPFGHSSTNLGSLYKGMRKNTKDNFQRFRKKVAKTKHTHHPVDDAMACAEALLKMRELGLKINLED